MLGKTIEEAKSHRAWIELDFNNLKYNYNKLKSISPNTKIMGILKGNAGGHGLIQMATGYTSLGIDHFAVATLSEALELRQANFTQDILILGVTDYNDLKYIKEYNLTQTIPSLDYALNIDVDIKCHLKIDTGLHRLGLSNKEDIDKCFSLNHLNITGIFTHLMCSEDETQKQASINQVDKFYNLTNDYIKKYNLIHHIQSSYGLIQMPELKCDYARVGMFMYGIQTSNKYTRIDLRQVLTLKAKVIHIQTLNKDESLGYCNCYKLNKTQKIATVSIGYHDGLTTCPKDAYVIIHNKKVPIIGTVCMDQCFIDVTDINDIKLFDEVTFTSNDLKIHEVAPTFSCSSTEFVAHLSNRLARIIKGSD